MIRRGWSLAAWRAFSAATALAVLALAPRASLAAPARQAAGPSVAIYGVDSRDYPAVTAYLAVTDAQGAPVVGLTPADVEILVDGQPLGDAPVNISSHTPSVAVALALDISVDFASFTEVQSAAREFVEAMGENDQAAVVVYASDVDVAQEFTNDQDSLIEAINGLTAEGTATNLNRAVSQTIAQLDAVEAQRKAVVVITNGGDTVGAVPVDTVVSQATAAGVPLYTMVFAPTVNINALRSMAQDTGGRAFVLDSAGEVSDSLASVGSGLRQGYSINFESPLPADSGQHDLSLTVTVDDQEAEAAATFEAVLVATPITLALSVTEGQQVLGVVNLTAQVASSTPITTVEYRLDGQQLAVLNTPPYSYQWDSTTVAAGLHILTARATDNAGRAGEAQVTLEVAEITPLLVTALVPRSVESGSAVTVNAQVDTTAPNVTVEFLVDGEVVGSDQEVPYSLTFSSEQYEAGEHTITVRASDLLGRTAENNVSIQFTPRPVSMGERAGLFVASLARYRRAFFGLVLVFLMLVVLIFAVALLRMNGNAKRQRLKRNVALDIVNSGNARSRYELWADDPGKVLAFQFSVDGEVLAVREPASAQPVRAASAARAQQQPGRRPQPAAERQAYSQPSGGGSRGGWGLSTAIGDLLSTVGYLLPGRSGNALFQASHGIRDAQYTSSRLENLGGQVTDVRGQAGAPPAPGQPQTEAATIIEPSGPPPLATDAARPGPVAPRHPARPKDSHPWVETPYVEPGETLTLNLLVDRVKSSGIQQHPFRVLSRCMEAPDKKPVIEQATIEMGRLPALLNLMPFLVLLAAAGIMLLLIALLIAPPGFVV